MGFSLGGNISKELVNALIDVKVSDKEIKLAFVNKENSAVFIDITFSYFKLIVGEAARNTTTKLSENEMKMLFDQMKTQVNEIFKKGSKENEKNDKAK